MKAHEVMAFKDQVEDLLHVSDILRCDGFFYEADNIEIAVKGLSETIERLRSEVANDG
jgi:hypothetical protein